MKRKELLDLVQMSREERSLLLYFETCAVDLAGRVDVRRMNQGDMEIAKRWNAEGFVRFGRIASKYHNRQGAHWIELRDDAWALAHEERKARNARMKRRYERTEEIPEESTDA